VNILARIFALFAPNPRTLSVAEVNELSACASMREERKFWRDRLRLAEKQARECRDELSKLDELEAMREVRSHG
jgi:hypothetical protein